MHLTPELRRMITERISALGTKKAFADLVGTNHQTVGRWVDSDQRMIDDKYATGLAHALGIPLNDLIGLSHGAGSSTRPDEVNDRFDKLLIWLRSEQPHVQEPFFKLAEGFGFKD